MLTSQSVLLMLTIDSSLAERKMFWHFVTLIQRCMQSHCAARMEHIRTKLLVLLYSHKTLKKVLKHYWEFISLEENIRVKNSTHIQMDLYFWKWYPKESWKRRPVVYPNSFSCFGKVLLPNPAKCEKVNDQLAGFKIRFYQFIWGKSTTKKIILSIKKKLCLNEASFKLHGFSNGNAVYSGS